MNWIYSNKKSNLKIFLICNKSSSKGFYHVTFPLFLSPLTTTLQDSKVNCYNSSDSHLLVFSEQFKGVVLSRQHNSLQANIRMSFNESYNIPRARLLNTSPVPAMDLKSNRSGCDLTC